MQNLKYHSLNVLSMLLFSYMTAVTINGVVKYKMTPDFMSEFKAVKKQAPISGKKTFDSYQDILQSSFFKMPDVGNVEGNPLAQGGAFDDLTLVGTITGPPAIARAMIQKKGEANPKIFALYKVSFDISNDVFGYKLVSILDNKVYLLVNKERKVLELFPKKPAAGDKMAQEVKGNYIKTTISRAEIKQKVLNNMDNALNGLRAGPYRINGQIQGFRLIQLRPFNILYKLGARSGDIVKRINGHVLDSTEKLYQMWEALKTESRITVDIERNNQVLTYDFSITD